MRYPAPEFKNPIWARQDWETSNRQWQAFEDFMSLPPSIRSISELGRIYAEIIKEGKNYVPNFLQDLSKTTHIKQGYIPPSSSDASLRKWASDNRWIERSIAFEQHQASLTETKRAEEYDRRIDVKVKTELDQVEEFRTQSIFAGKNTFSVGAHILQLVGLTIGQYPVKPVKLLPGEDPSSIRQPGPLSKDEVEKLDILSRIYDRANRGILVGQEQWAVALGVKEAVEVLTSASADNIEGQI